MLFATTDRFRPVPASGCSRVLSRTARHLAPDGRDAVGGRLAGLVGRRHRTVRGGASGRSRRSPGRPSPALFLPYLGGERTPHNDGTIRGAFAGLSHDTDRRLLTQAVLEGVAFSLRDCLDALPASGTRIEAADVIGGGSRSRVWIAHHRVCPGIPLIPSGRRRDGGAFGAARLARMAVTGEAPEAVCTPPARAETIHARSGADLGLRGTAGRSTVA